MSRRTAKKQSLATIAHVAAVISASGQAGTRWGVQAALAAIAALAIAVLLIERQMESRRA